MAVVPGIGYLILEDLMEDVSYSLIEPVVSQSLPSAITPGAQTIAVFDPAIYVGCMLVVGATTINVEVVTVTETTGSSFSAVFTNSHAIGESIRGATFPVRWPTDQFFTQNEVIGYFSQACNDFLADCPLAVVVGDVTVPPTTTATALPSDCMTPVRVAVANYPLRETSQSHLDQMEYGWAQQAASEPRCYFRDKVGLQRVGIFPRANNTTPMEVTYQQRSAASLGLADGFIIPDPFLIYVRHRVLSFAYSKDGEQRNQALADHHAQRYAMGIKISNMFLEAINDSNLEMSEG